MDTSASCVPDVIAEKSDIFLALAVRELLRGRATGALEEGPYAAFADECCRLDGTDPANVEAGLLHHAASRWADQVLAPMEIPLKDGVWYWVALHGFGEQVTAPAMYRANVDCFYSYEFSGIPRRELTLLRPA